MNGGKFLIFMMELLKALLPDVAEQSSVKIGETCIYIDMKKKSWKILAVRETNHQAESSVNHNYSDTRTF